MQFVFQGTLSFVHVFKWIACSEVAIVQLITRHLGVPHDTPDFIFQQELPECKGRLLDTLLPP